MLPSGCAVVLATSVLVLSSASYCACPSWKPLFCSDTMDTPSLVSFCHIRPYGNAITPFRITTPVGQWHRRPPTSAPSPDTSTSDILGNHWGYQQVWAASLRPNLFWQGDISVLLLGPDKASYKRENRSDERDRAPQHQCALWGSDKFSSADKSVTARGHERHGTPMGARDDTTVNTSVHCGGVTNFPVRNTSVTARGHDRHGTPMGARDATTVNTSVHCGGVTNSQVRTRVFRRTDARTRVSQREDAHTRSSGAASQRRHEPHNTRTRGHDSNSPSHVSRYAKRNPVVSRAMSRALGRRGTTQNCGTSRALGRRADESLRHDPKLPEEKLSNDSSCIVA